MKLETAESAYGTRWPIAEAAPRLYWQAPVPVNLRAEVSSTTDAIMVYVNHGRWIAECPDCHGAQLSSPADRRFMCHCCGNVAINGKWRPVLWPAGTTGLEAALEQRPKLARNWLPGETVAHLLAENDRMMGGRR